MEDDENPYASTSKGSSRAASSLDNSNSDIVENLQILDKTKDTEFMQRY